MFDRLSTLIGKKFNYLGNQWILIEIMPENDSLVLQRNEPHQQIQNNRFGSPSRYSQETLTLRISSPDTEQDYSEELTLLLSGIIKS